VLGDGGLPAPALFDADAALTGALDGRLVKFEAALAQVERSTERDLGDVSASESVTINQLATDPYGEVYSALQISGATLSGIISNSDNDIASASSYSIELTGVSADSFVFAVGGSNNNNANRAATGTTPTVDWFGGQKAGGSNAHHLYDLGSAAGDLTYGFTLGGGSDGAAMAAIALAPGSAPPDHHVSPNPGVHCCRSRDVGRRVCWGERSRVQDHQGFELGLHSRHGRGVL
jgi:hypothetical protein